MQQVNTPKSGLRRRKRDKAMPTEKARKRADIRLGVFGLLAVVILLAGIGVVSLVKFGESTYTAELADAGSVRSGDDVRIAGITVGAVKSVDLLPDRVEMKFSVKRDVFIGDATTLDVRMLTVVGGHYVAVLPAGAKPLGKSVIPANRVTLPYNLPQLFEDAIRPVRETDGDVLRRNVGAVESKLDGSPEGVRSLLTAMDNISAIVDRQNSEVSRTLAVADEYTAALDKNLGSVITLVDKLNLLETLIHDYKDRTSVALRSLANVLQGAAPLGQAWNSTLEPLAEPFAASIPKLEAMSSKLSALLASVQSMQERLRPLLTDKNGIAIDQSAAAVVAPSLCIPVPGKAC